MEILERIHSKAALPGQLSVSSLTAGEHVLVDTAAVKLGHTGKEGKRKASPHGWAWEVNFFFKSVFDGICIKDVWKAFWFFFLSPISGFGKLYLIIAKNFRTIFKVFSVSFDHDLMDGTQTPSMGLKWYKLIMGPNLQFAFSSHYRCLKPEFMAALGHSGLPRWKEGLCTMCKKKGGGIHKWIQNVQ